jgi:hypothetical protein
MNEIRVSLPNLVLLLAVVGGGSFAAGRAVPGASPPATSATLTAAEPEPLEEQEPTSLPPGHPAIDDPVMQQPGAVEAVANPAPADDAALEWKAPTRWQRVQNPSAMRLATYRIPRAQGDAADAELSVTRVGGSADANATRWIGQFDEAGQRTAKRTTRQVGSAEVVMVEVEGTYSGAMGKDRSSQPGWALLGAIVPTPDIPYFFKLTGPKRSVLAARTELDALIDSLATPRNRGL